jgi:hypothetical protein
VYACGLFCYLSENAAHPSIVAMQTNGLKITFEFTKPAGSPQTTIIKATHTNLSSSPYTDYLFQAAVPKVNSQHLRVDIVRGLSLLVKSFALQ